MAEITLHSEVAIDSAHYLKGYDGACARLHGHTWFVEIWVRGTSEDKDDVGIIWDFTRVKELKEELDHQLLNEIEPFDKINPSAENIVEYIYNRYKAQKPNLKFKIRVYETAVGKSTWAETGDFE